MTDESIQTQDSSAVLIIKRPWSVTLLAVIVLIITIINLIRFMLSIRYWAFISSLSIISPLYLVLTGLIWGAAGVVLSWGLLKPRSWAPRLMQAVGLTYALYYWLDQVFLKTHPISGTSGLIRAILPTNWRFAAIVTVVCLALMEWVLSRANVKAYFSSVGISDRIA